MSQDTISAGTAFNRLSRLLYKAHCKEPVPIIWNKYYQKRNFAATVPISTFLCLWAIYIVPQSLCLFCCRKYVDRSWEINKSLTDTWMFENWDWGRAIPRKGIHKWDFRCSVCKLHKPYLHGTDTDMTENIWFGKQKNASEWRQLVSVLLVIYLMLRSFDIQEFRGLRHWVRWNSFLSHYL